MRISTKGRYALRMMLDLAQHRGDGFVSLRDIADRQGISKKYLEQIIPLFNKSGFLKAERGSQGGYRLARTPEQYTIGDILRLTETSLSPVPCAEQNPIECERCAECLTLPVWQGLFRAINDYLDSVTLQDLLDRHSQQNGNDYII